MSVDSNRVSKVIVLNENEEVLVLTRKDNGRFDLPGGHVHVGEEHMMGAIREVYEETKLVLLDIRELIKYDKKVLYISKKFGGLIELDQNENTEYQWLEPHSFLKIDPENATDVVVAYQAYLRKRQSLLEELKII